VIVPTRFFFLHVASGKGETIMRKPEKGASIPAHRVPKVPASRSHVILPQSLIVRHG